MVLCWHLWNEFLAQIFQSIAYWDVIWVAVEHYIPENHMTTVLDYELA